MGAMASQMTSLTTVYSTVHSGTDQGKHQSSASLAFVRGIHRWPVNSPHKWPVTRKMFPFDDVVMKSCNSVDSCALYSDVPDARSWTRLHFYKSQLELRRVTRRVDGTPTSEVTPVTVGTRRNNNVFITSKRRRLDVMKTLSLRHYCVMCPLG